MTVDPVELINSEDKPFWIAGLARELWPLLFDRLNELTNDARIAVEHYADQHNEEIKA